jgi:quercetin dioxygenase-like cupin family protein
LAVTILALIFTINSMEQGTIVPDPPKYDRRYEVYHGKKQNSSHRNHNLKISTWLIHACSRPLPLVELAYQNKLPNCPGKSSVGLIVTYPPRGSTPPHRHGGASVCAYVIAGTVLSKMNDEPTRVFEQGGSWFEAPGCHHRVSDNYSTTEQAKLLATLIVDTEVVEKGGLAALVVYDDEYKDVAVKT